MVMSPLSRIISFSQSRPSWQQDLIRRIYTKGELTNKDVDEALQMLKAQFDLEDPRKAPCPECLQQEHLPYQTEMPPQTVLLSLGDAKNVNRLAENQFLPFATNGITLIYGDNGSGKSGYCRILKKLCRVRDGADEKILGNAFDDRDLPPAEVTVRYSVDGEINEVVWRDGDTAPEELSLFSVFDTKTIPIYADKENKLEFLPHSLDILPKLGDVCTVLNTKIEGEIVQLERNISTPLPTFPPGTESADITGKLITATPLKSLATIQQIADASTWTDQKEQQLSEIERVLRTDARAMASQCQQLKRAVEQIDSDLDGVEKILSDAAVKDLIDKKTTAVATRSAADAAAQMTFEDEPLPGVGSDAWRLMFSYAREYSAIAYPEEQFPVTDPDKVCLLCQQPLSDEASERLQRFDRFVKDTAAEEAEKAEKAFSTDLTAIERYKLRASSDAETMLPGLDQVDGLSAGIKEQIARFLESALARRIALITLRSEAKRFEEIPGLTPSPRQALALTKERLANLIEVYQRSQDPDARQKLENDKKDLLARKKLSEHASVFLKRREDLVRLAKLRKCKAACSTNAISRKNSELREAFITEEYQDRLEQEVNSFNLHSIPLKVQSRSDRGVSYIGVDLDTSKPVRNKDILSDGEFRALAIASFLTEIGTIPSHSGIIIDDPVSSLDHDRTHLVAERLVKEAKNGAQLIVFTHDLVFYHELEMAAGQAEVPLVPHWVHFSPEHGFGTIGNNDEPWQTKTVKKRLGHLEKKFADIKKMQDQNGDMYRGTVTGFYANLRETWERLVEEQLLNGVVTRFGPGVATQSLKGVQVEDEDYRKIYYGMKRASEFSGHDTARGRQKSLPTPEEISMDLVNLREYSTTLAQRIKKLENDRRKIEKPPEAVVL